MSKLVSLVSNNRLKIEMEKTQSGVTIRMIGAVEELNREILLKAVTDASGQPIRFDLGYLSRINSRGIREWLLLQQQIPADVRYTFIQVNETLFSLANEIPGMLGHGKVESLLVPYFCANCKNIPPVALSVKDLVSVQGELTAPELTCTTCSSPIRADVESRYFRSLAKS